MSLWPGLFISFEGVDGSGKTTQQQRLYQRLMVHFSHQQREIITTREPGGCYEAERIRNVLLHDELCQFDSVGQALLLAAARRQHWQTVILPALQRGAIVLCDRFIDSTLVYQGYAQEGDPDFLWQLFSMTTPQALPDITFLIMVDTEVAVSRRSNRELQDTIEKKGITFQQKIAKGYAILAQEWPSRIVQIDGAQKEIWIENTIFDRVKDFFGIISGSAIATASMI